MRHPLATLCLLAAAAPALAAPAAKPLPKLPPPDPRELPYFMVPIPMEAAEAYWAPDSKHLIAQTRDPDAIKTLQGTNGALTWIFSDDGKEMWRVNDRGQDACSYFFPDGETVVWTSTRDNMQMPVGNWSDSNDYPQGGEIYLSDWRGKNVRRMTDNKYYEAEVSVSPDGQWLAYGRQIDGLMDIWVQRVTTGEQFQVTRTADWQEGAPFFLPDNKTIIFRAWLKADYDNKVKPTPMTIFTINRDGTDWRRHTFDRGMNWHPTPAPDGRHYVYVRAVTPTNWEIMLGDLAGGEPKQLTYYDKLDILAHISPDGKKMNWGRATGDGFMGGIRTFVMDVSSLNLGKENYVPFNPAWGQKMEASK